ncbi:MAG: polar amino acid transport system substrate-binding protein [Gammaproteobacteria bacterium]
MTKISLYFGRRLFNRVAGHGYCLLVLMMMAVPGFAASADVIKLHAVTSSFPPLQMLEAGKPGGYVVSIVELLAKDVSQQINQPIQLEIEFLPWKRGLRTASSVLQNILLFSLSRTPDRENLFHWVGIISPYDIHLFTLDPDLPTALQSLDAIRDSDKVIGVQAGSNVEEHLHSNGFVEGKDFITVADYHEGIKMLYRKRVDYVPMTSFLARGNVCDLSLNPDSLVKSIRLDGISRPLWVVFSKSTNAKLVQSFTKALESFNASNKSQRIAQSQVVRWTNRICAAQL